MARTFFDAGVWTPRESWRVIRSFRAAPPTEVAAVLQTDNRSDVFHMALEQSEQLFRAAAEVERESRPLLLFYGLSQAGRALAAASAHLAWDQWEASGHGLRARVSKVTPAAIWDLETSVQPAKADLFSRSSAALSSATDIGDVTLGAAATNIVEFVYEFRDFKAYPRVVSINRVHNPGPTADPILLAVAVDLEDEPDVPSFLASVPLLSAFDYQRDTDGAPQLDHNGSVLVVIPRSEFEFKDGDARLRGRQRYRGQDVAVRKLGDSTAAVNPLMVWWLVLHALSNLARYEPRKWGQILDIRKSPAASQIEHLGDRALDAIPHLLAEALATLNT